MKSMAISTSDDITPAVIFVIVLRPSPSPSKGPRATLLYSRLSATPVGCHLLVLILEFEWVMTVLLISLIWSCFFALAVRQGQVPVVNRMPPEEADRRCSRYSALLSNVETDLSRWKQAGISQKLMQQTINLHTHRTKGQKGFAAGFRGGKAYLLGRPELTKVGHHATLHAVYMRLLMFLESTFTMPDVVGKGRRPYWDALAAV